MVRIYVHIGTPKTGTTTLQRFLCKNEKNLLDLGYLYPQSGRPSYYPIAHYNLAHAMRFQEKIYAKHAGRWEDLSSQFSDLHREIEQKKPSNVIVSSESFGKRSEYIEKLQEEFSRYDVKILVYLREQKDFLTSYYIESIKQGSSKNFEDFLCDEWNIGDYYNYLLPWSNSFGKENVTVRILKKNKLKGNLFEDFLASVGIKNPSKFDMNITNHNISPPAKAVNLLRYLNLIAISRLSIPYHVCQKIYLNRFIYGKKWQALIQKIPNFLISEELIASKFDFDDYLSKFEDTNRQVLSEYFPSQEAYLFDE
jgi:hypothetical protein